MFSKRNLLGVLLLSFLSLSVHPQQRPSVSVTMNNVKLLFSLTQDGKPQYELFYGLKPVIHSSNLGFTFDQGISLTDNFKVLKIDSSNTDENWKPVWGEVNQIRNHYKQLTAHLQQQNSNEILMDVIFKVYEDGIGFRYEFPLQPHLKYFTVSAEKTEFNLTGNHKAFWIPGDYDSNEYLYTTSRLSEVDAWKLPILSVGSRKENEPDQFAVQTPLMMKTVDGLYINIHEAALIDYPSMQLHVNKKTFGLSCNLVPDAVGNKAYLRAPAHTPWRTILVSNKATDILASKTILNLNDPSKIENTSWIKPMKFVGVWWEMQVGKTNWNYTDDLDKLSADGKLIPNGHHGANTANVKRYIDFAAKEGIKGVLIEGWNTGWEEWGADKEEKFDFVTPYPDFDIKEISAYAKLKDVQMIMHNETGGSATSYDRHLDTAFSLMKKFGYPAVKTGYVGKIVPRGEHHDGQWMVNHFLRAAQKAAQYQIMIDMHEPVRPTGLQRTYPNFMASEAGRGNEWNFFSIGSPPEHETIMPFTRLMGGPMDYTPGIFKLRNYAPGVPERQMHSTLAKQLALYVTMYSPLQMAADAPENYNVHLDAFQFIKDVAVDWDDTKIIEAEPGDYITIARKSKGKEDWFIGAITDENKRTSIIALSFLNKNTKYIATIYSDTKDANWKSKPESYQIKKASVDSNSKLKLYLAPGGGTAIEIRPTSSY